MKRAKWLLVAVAALLVACQRSESNADAGPPLATVSPWIGTGYDSAVRQMQFNDGTRCVLIVYGNRQGGAGIACDWRPE